MPAIARFLYITIDAQDAERIADFWTAVLDTEREEELDEGRFLVREALGGTWDGEDRILDGIEWRTFADPEGHEFDILRVGSP